MTLAIAYLADRRYLSAEAVNMFALPVDTITTKVRHLWFPGTRHAWLACSAEGHLSLCGEHNAVTDRHILTAGGEGGRQRTADSGQRAADNGQPVADSGSGGTNRPAAAVNATGERDATTSVPRQPRECTVSAALIRSPPVCQTPVNLSYADYMQVM